jgi:hypothetical protein
MDVPASPDELPELKEFLGTLQVRFRRPECQSPAMNAQRLSAMLHNRSAEIVPSTIVGNTV